MGSTKLRRLLNNESKWVDKDAPRHKHDYSEHTIVQLRNVDKVSYYDVMKCKRCNSFKAISKPMSAMGFIGNTYDGDLPILKLYRSHKWIIGFSGATLEL